MFIGYEIAHYSLLDFKFSSKKGAQCVDVLLNISYKENSRCYHISIVEPWQTMAIYFHHHSASEEVTCKLSNMTVVQQIQLQLLSKPDKGLCAYYSCFSQLELERIPLNKTRQYKYLTKRTCIPKDYNYLNNESNSMPSSVEPFFDNNDITSCFSVVNAWV